MRVATLKPSPRGALKREKSMCINVTILIPGEACSANVTRARAPDTVEANFSRDSSDLTARCMERAVAACTRSYICAFSPTHALDESQLRKTVREFANVYTLMLYIEILGLSTTDDK